MANHKTEQRSDVRTGRDADSPSKSDTKTGQQGTKGIRLDRWQEQVLDAKGHFLLCTGRQVGKTTIFAIKACRHMLDHPASKIIVVSLTEDQAELIIIMALNYLEKNHKPSLKRGLKFLTKKKITLKNKSTMLSRPVGQTGDALRGFTADILIIDEASKMPESVFTAAKPTLLTTGGKIWMCSTPFGKKGYFYESWLNKNKRFKVFHISSESVIAERNISDTWTELQRVESMKLLDEEKLDMGRLQYAQEYLGLFLDDLQQIFTDELIAKTCVLKRQPNHRGVYFLGCDFARMGSDSSSYEIIRREENGRLTQVESITTIKKFTNETYDKIIELDKAWDLKQIGIDAGSGSLGVGILDWLMKPASGVNKKVIPLNNLKRVLDKWGTRTRGLLKEDLYSNLLLLMERGEITLLDDDNLRLSLKSCQQEYVMKDGQKTKVKIYSSRHKDSDIVEGLVRSAWLANQKVINTSISYF